MDRTPTIMHGTRYVDLPKRDAERIYELGKTAIAKQVSDPINKRYQRKYDDRIKFRMQGDDIEYTLVMSHSRKGVKRIALDYYAQTGGGILGTGSTLILKIDPVFEALTLPENPQIQASLINQRYFGRAEDSVKEFLSSN